MPIRVLPSCRFDSRMRVRLFEGEVWDWEFSEVLKRSSSDLAVISPVFVDGLRACIDWDSGDSTVESCFVSDFVRWEGAHPRNSRNRSRCRMRRPTFVDAGSRDT